MRGWLSEGICGNVDVCEIKHGTVPSVHCVRDDYESSRCSQVRSLGEREILSRMHIWQVWLGKPVSEAGQVAPGGADAFEGVLGTA